MTPETQRAMGPCCYTYEKGHNNIVEKPSADVKEALPEAKGLLELEEA